LGRIFKRKDSRFWWVSLAVRGKRYTESARSIRKVDAQALLAKRIEQFRVVPGLLSRVTVSELLDDYLGDLELREARALGRFERHAQVLREHLGSRVAALLEPGEVYELQQALRKRYAPATVNFTVGFLRTAYRHGARNGRIERRLEFPRALPVNNARKGFLEYADYLAILEELPEWARDPFRFAYQTGWRRGEVLSLRWDEIDFEARIVCLDAARSKNREGRTFPFIGELVAVLSRRQRARILGLPWVFHRFARRISGSCFVKHFRQAATIAGRPKLIVHDCRRSAIRNLLRMGVRREVAMAMVGWKTLAMMTRYAIVSESDLEDAAAKANDYLERQSAEARARVLPF
jgi:integrase